jgi:abortive infection bacteriophage resistance protein
MSKIPYLKPALTYEQQLHQLKERGLTIGNEEKALHLLESISYYRLSGYWYPLLADKQLHQFKKGATFETAFQLYCFDKDLRKLIIAELEKIEIAVRAKMIYTLSHNHDAFWFSNPLLFGNPVQYAKTLAKIDEEYNRSDEEFIKAFKNKYSDSLPPAWMTMEIISFGTLSMLYKNLKPGQDKRAIAHYFGLADSVLGTWLHSIVYLRNVCAHHTRLWNRVMSISPQIPRTPNKKWLTQVNIQNNRTYFMLCMIKYLLQTVHLNTTLTTKLKNLLAKYPNVDIKAMGFTANWDKEPLWLV